VSRRFVLLDRDGTINEEVGYVLRPDELRLIPGAVEALRDLQGLGPARRPDQPVADRPGMTPPSSTIHGLRDLLAEGCHRPHRGHLYQYEDHAPKPGADGRARSPRRLRPRESRWSATTGPIFSSARRGAARSSC
jgi:D-glycero-D-manno-heptose 1,7-bisphosphate phosphatase